MVDHTADNVEKMVTDVVDSWDIDTLVGYARATLTNDYMEDEELFHEDWQKFYE